MIRKHDIHLEFYICIFPSIMSFFSKNQLIELPRQTKLIISNIDFLLSSLKVSVAIH